MPTGSCSLYSWGKAYDLTPGKVFLVSSSKSAMIRLSPSPRLGRQVDSVLADRTYCAV